MKKPKIMRQSSRKIGLKSSKNRQKSALLHHFYENPLSTLTVRQLADERKLSRSTVQYYLANPRAEGFVSVATPCDGFWGKVR